MQSELHERLEYLVNYSSQLIFVSGDSIAEQQKTLEAFVFQQHDDTDIAYLTAQDNMDISDYRRQLCRQLLGQVVGSFVRPLNELLVDLNTHEGPILIAITQAHHLPDKLLQELWDLVLQSRFAGNKQHLNVLLFADSQWAESAKQWLPAKNTETPLIISSQSVISEQPTFESDLDKMIASRREAFQAHLENRQRENRLTFSNPLASKWFYAAIASVFLTTFTGLVYWQYGDDISGLFTPIAPTDTQNTQSQVVPGSAYDSLLDEEQTALVTEETQSPNDALPANGKVDNSANALPSTGDKTASLDIASSDNGLVTDWDSALSSIPAREPAAIPTPNIAPSSLSSTASATNQSATDNAADTQEASLVVRTTPLSTTNPTSAEEAVEVPNNSVPNDISTTADWITPSQYVIQMLAMKDKSVLQQFLQENSLMASTRIYKTQRYGGDWFVVIATTLYPTFESAQQARESLPEFAGKQNAFVKGGDQVLSELSLNQPNGQ